MNSTGGSGPPTCPNVLSFETVRNEPPVDSVYPYPSKIGQQQVVFKKLSTSILIGALAVIITLTLPPNTAFVLLNTRLS